MIDTKEVWRKINSTDPMDHIDLHATIMTLLPSLLNRLEVAESDCLEQARLNGMGASREAALMAKLEAAEKERDWNAERLEDAIEELTALRAHIEKMEKQEPVGKIVAFGESLHEPSWRGGRLPPLMTELYALPGTQTQSTPSIPERWKLVPIEPTEEMLHALIDGANQYDAWKEGYRDMLAAAPEAKP